MGHEIRLRVSYSSSVLYMEKLYMEKGSLRPLGVRASPPDLRCTFITHCKSCHLKLRAVQGVALLIRIALFLNEGYLLYFRFIIARDEYEYISSCRGHVACLQHFGSPSSTSSGQKRAR